MFNPCTSFLTDIRVSSATVCRNCGTEKHLHSNIVSGSAAERFRLLTYGSPMYVYDAAKIVVFPSLEMEMSTEEIAIKAKFLEEQRRSDRQDSWVRSIVFGLYCMIVTYLAIWMYGN